MKITNKFNLPAPLVAFVSRDTYSRGASQYSVTELMSPPKIKRLQEQYDTVMERDASEMIASRMGSSMHSLLEQKDYPGYLNEERIFTEMDGVIISGAIDLQHGHH